MNKLSKIRREGEILPPFYYGHSFNNWEYGECVYHIIPINYFIRFFRLLEFLWYKIRSKPGYVEKQIQEGICLKTAKYYDVFYQEIKGSTKK